MITELTNSDHAGTVVSRINAAIEEQNKGVDTLGANPNASTVISRVNAAIDAESNDQLEDVYPSDNAVDFIRKTNALFASINAGGGDEPTPPEPDYAYWSGKNYIAFGDSITYTGSWAWPPNLASRYCYLVSMPPESDNEEDYKGLGMNLNNAGLSGMLMLDNGAYSYPITNGARIEGEQRSFSKEWLNPNGATIIDVADENYRGQYRGPYGYDRLNTPLKLWEYDLITLMFGTNDIDRIRRYERGVQSQFAEIGNPESTELTSFYGAYTRSLAKITRLLRENNANTVVVICIPPKATASTATYHYYSSIGDLVTPITNIANSFGLPIVDFYNNCTVELKDGVHPNEAGHRVLADYLKLRLGEIAAELHLSDN